MISILLSLLLNQAHAVDLKSLNELFPAGEYQVTKLGGDLGKKVCPARDEFFWLDGDDDRAVFKISAQVALPIVLSKVNGQAVADPENSSRKRGGGCEIFETFKLDTAKKIFTVITDFKCAKVAESGQTTETLVSQGNKLLLSKTVKGGAFKGQSYTCQFEKLK